MYENRRKAFSFRGLRPPDPQQWPYPWTPLGALHPDPRYRLALHALAMVRLWQILDPFLPGYLFNTRQSPG